MFCPSPRRPGRGVALLHLRLRHDSDVGLRRLPALRILLLGVLIGHRAGDDHVFAILPVHRSRDLVLGGELERVDHPQPSSVVHTGVKSFGCEKSTAQELPIQSWKRILPSVVCASKSGAVSLIARVITYLRYMRERDGLGIAQQSDYTAV